MRINSRTTAKDLVKMLAETGKTESLSTVKRVLYHELKGYSGRRKPLLQNHHKMQDYCLQLHMGSKINFWRHILWSDETKIELFGHNDKRYIWKKNGKALKFQNTIPTVKYGVVV